MSYRFNPSVNTFSGMRDNLANAVCRLHRLNRNALRANEINLDTFEARDAAIDSAFRTRESALIAAKFSTCGNDWEPRVRSN